MINEEAYIDNFYKLDTVEEMQDSQDGLLFALDSLDTAITALKEIYYYKSDIDSLEEIKAKMEVMADQTVEEIEERMSKEQKEHDKELMAMNYSFERSRL